MKASEKTPPGSRIPFPGKTDRSGNCLKGWGPSAVILALCFSLGWWAGQNPKLREYFLAGTELQRAFSTSSMLWMPQSPIRTLDILWTQLPDQSDLHFRLLTESRYWNETPDLSIFQDLVEQLVHPDFITRTIREQNVFPLFWKKNNDADLQIVVLEANPNFKSHSTIRKLLDPEVQKKWVLQIPFGTTLKAPEDSNLPAEKKASQIRLFDFKNRPSASDIKRK
ncbi:MAG: hypothetical protein WCH11_00045 [Bdellovibrio sp.]